VSGLDSSLKRELRRVVKGLKSKVKTGYPEFDTQSSVSRMNEEGD